MFQILNISHSRYRIGNHISNALAMDSEVSKNKNDISWIILEPVVQYQRHNLQNGLFQCFFFNFILGINWSNYRDTSSEMNGTAYDYVPLNFSHIFFQNNICSTIPFSYEATGSLYVHNRTIVTMSFNLDLMMMWHVAHLENIHCTWLFLFERTRKK